MRWAAMTRQGCPMNKNQMVWLADNDGTQTAAVNGYHVSVERVLPVADATFNVRAERHAHRIAASGTRALVAGGDVRG